MYLEKLKPTLNHKSILDWPLTNSCELIISKAAITDESDNLKEMWEVWYAFITNKLWVKTITSRLCRVISESLEIAAQEALGIIDNDNQVIIKVLKFDKRTDVSKIKELEMKLNNLPKIHND